MGEPEQECRRCRGKGVVGVIIEPDDVGATTFCPDCRQSCEACRGSGTVAVSGYYQHDAADCPDCDGLGHVPRVAQAEHAELREQILEALHAYIGKPPYCRSCGRLKGMEHEDDCDSVREADAVLRVVQDTAAAAADYALVRNHMDSAQAEAERWRLRAERLERVAKAARAYHVDGATSSHVAVQRKELMLALAALEDKRDERP